jgi:ribosome-binding protein aMBF1 (putative translation factor)
MSESEKFRPVKFDPKGYARKRGSTDKNFKVAYDNLSDEFEALAALLHARNAAGLTQAEVAERMGVTQPVVARIESSIGKKTHSPTVESLRRYANACGMKLVIRMVAQ